MVSFLPFPTRLVAENIDHADAERVAVTIYGVTLLLVSVLLSGLWRYARTHDLARSDIPDRNLDSLAKRLSPASSDMP